MNFQKGSKWPLTLNPHTSEWSLSLEILCMHSMLSEPYTSLHMCSHIHYKKLQYNFPKIREGVEAVWNFSENSSDLLAWPVPQLLHMQQHVIRARAPKHVMRVKNKFRKKMRGFGCCLKRDLRKYCERHDCCYMNLSTLIHGFLYRFMWIFQSCNMAKKTNWSLTKISKLVEACALK